jgi:hypothetical protein
MDMSISAKLAAGAICIFATATPAAAQPHGATSVYTNLNLSRCRVTESHPEGPDTQWRCPGYSGIPLFAASSDDRFFLDAGAQGDPSVTSSAFSSPAGERVEWRVRGGRPFALIYGLTVSGSADGDHRVLAVKTVGRAGRRPCLVAWVDGAQPDANARARQEADRRAAAFRCGRDRPRLIGNPYGVSVD